MWRPIRARGLRRLGRSPTPNSRSAKSGNHWGLNDLRLYNIVVKHEKDAAVFFEMTCLPQSFLHCEFLEKMDAVDIKDLRSCLTVGAMDLAMAGEETAVDDFASFLFNLLGYTSRDIGMQTRKDIEFCISGKSVYAKTGVCLLRRQSETILLVQEDRRHLGHRRGHPEAQLIAKAIAAFQSNNEKRYSTGLPLQDQCLIAGILMIGAAPVFYKIPVTRELADAVALSKYPPNPSTVYSHPPPIPRPDFRYLEGMKPLDNRRIILQCYEAFKKFLNTQDD